MRACSRAPWRATRSFDAAIFGSSTGYPLDPQRIGDGTSWTVAQLAIPGGPAAQPVARGAHLSAASQRPRQPADLHPGRPLVPPGRSGGGSMGRVSGLDLRKLRPRISVAHPVSRGRDGRCRRLAIRADLMQPLARADGFMPTNLTPVPRARLTRRFARPPIPRRTTVSPRWSCWRRTSQDCRRRPAGVRVHAALRQHAAGAGSPAEARLQACKARARQIAALRPNTAYLDLMTENAITTD